MKRRCRVTYDRKKIANKDGLVRDSVKYFDTNVKLQSLHSFMFTGHCVWIAVTDSLTQLALVSDFFSSCLTYNLKY